MIRCKNRCNLVHDGCCRGDIPEDFFVCHTASSALTESTLTYVKFETTEVETYGTGKPYSRMEKIELELSLTDFLESFRKEFMKYAHHIVAAWFLRSTKLAFFNPSINRKSILTIISDFGEAYLVIGKHETADQFFKRREVNIHGSVCSFLVPVEDDESEEKFKEVNISFIVSSDFKYVQH